MSSVDVLVVGGGPTGLTAGLLLAQLGLSVAVAERDSGPSDEPRAISVVDEALRTMQRVGILDALKPEMLMDTGSRYFGIYDRLLAEAKPRKSRLGLPAKSQFDQPVMESLLFEAAIQHDSIELLLDTSVESFVQDSDGVTANLTTHEGARQLRAAWMIAADGGRSAIREQLQIGMIGSTQVEKWIVIDLLDDVAHEPFAQFHCDGVRPHVIVPGANRRCRYEFMLLPGESARDILSLDSVRELLAPYRSVEKADIRRAAVYVAHQLVARRFRSGRVLLAGDAAHLMPPFAGQGLNAGIRDAVNLAWKVAAVVREGADDSLIDTYESERRPHATDMVRLSHRIGTIVMNVNPIVARLRDVAILGLGALPQAKAWVVGMRFVRPPHLTSGLVVVPTRRVPVAARDLVGRSLFQPEVEIAGLRTPLDSILGEGWALLAIGGIGFEGIRPAFWNRIGTRFVRLDASSLGSSAGPAARELGSELTNPAILAKGPLYVLVRPDRYVAGITSPAELSRLEMQLGHFYPERRTAGLGA